MKRPPSILENMLEGGSFQWIPVMYWLGVGINHSELIIVSYFIHIFDIWDFLLKKINIKIFEEIWPIWSSQYWPGYFNWWQSPLGRRVLIIFDIFVFKYNKSIKITLLMSSKFLQSNPKIRFSSLHVCLSGSSKTSTDMFNLHLST